MIKQD